MYSYFEYNGAVYSIFNDKHFIHYKSWDNIPGFKYYKQEITAGEYMCNYWRYCRSGGVK